MTHQFPTQCHKFSELQLLLHRQHRLYRIFLLIKNMNTIEQRDLITTTMKATHKNLLIILFLYSSKIIMEAANHNNYANSTYHFLEKSNENIILTETNGEQDHTLSRILCEAYYCGDDHFFTFLGTRKCSYIFEKKSVATKRRLNLCKNNKIKNACKYSCGHCSYSTFQVSINICFHD